MTKRSFFRRIGGGISAVRLLVSGAAAQTPPTANSKFQPLDLRRFFTGAASDVGPRPRAAELGGASTRDRLIRTPTGRQTFHGIPFELADEDDPRQWAILSRKAEGWSTGRIEIPLTGNAPWICMAAFCDWDDREWTPTGVDEIDRAGQTLAESVFVYEDSTEAVQPLRRRFEVNSLTHPWGHDCFTATAHRPWEAARLNESLRNATLWGLLQTSIRAAPAQQWNGSLWITSIRNPHAERKLRALRLEARADDWLAVCGLTTFHESADPLLRDRLRLFQITLPTGQDSAAWDAGIDLGTVARTYHLPAFQPDRWLAAPVIGLGERSGTPHPGILYAEITAHPGATLRLRRRDNGESIDLPLSQLPLDGPARVEIIEDRRAWVHGRVVDESTGKPTPVRISFRAPNGRHLRPYGHRTEVNGGWFQDYGADVQRDGTPFSYIDGTYQMEMPVGDVYVEITKGFEYEPIRRRIQIRAGQRDLQLSVPRLLNLRARNWVSADSHVHFLSPSTAILEAQAEGLNLIHLLAAQWGDLFTNVGDLPHGNLTSADGEAIVALGSENRQHLLGHLGLLGAPVMPMSAGGPPEDYLGGPAWNSLAEWADACRERQGLVVAAHFPYPEAEIAADIVLGKIDALELQPRGIGEHFHSHRFHQWYRYLNCGYRLPAVGGTDKMNASVAAGAFRAYVNLGGQDLSFANWAAAVRRGNTFMTSGPLLLFSAEGRVPGEEIVMRSTGGRVEVEVEAHSTIPFHRVEIVANGHVVASREEREGTKALKWRESVAAPSPGWLAARCSSRVSYNDIQIAAHTSPVYITAPGSDLFSGPAATHMLTLIDGSEAWVRKLAVTADAERAARVLALFSEARRRLHERMHRHGIPH